MVHSSRISLMKKPGGPLIMGKNSIRELLRQDPHRIVKIFALKGTRDDLYEELQKNRIPIEFLSKQELFQLVQTDSHQSFVALIKQRTTASAQEFLKKSQDVDAMIVLMLDSIQDPHNFGAILRAAECFGVDAVVYSKNRGVEITPVVTKVSSGASELVPLLKVSNLAETVSLFQEADFSVVAADVGEGASSIYEFIFPKKMLLILGSEGSGIQSLLKKKSDHIVYVPMMGKIDSLNVSQAAAVSLFAYRRYISSIKG